MFGSIRRHLSYANVTATVAMVFAMSGGALAASHYLITKTSQIAPKVRTALKGQRGVTGPAGSQGKEGAGGKEGKEGAKGEPGPLLSALPSGKTEKGAYAFASTRFTKEGGGAYAPAVETSYPIPLTFEPNTNIIKPKASPTAACPGSVENPTATAGNLCIYAEREDAPLEPENAPAKGHFGFLAFFFVGEGANYEDKGTWAVTAP